MQSKVKIRFAYKHGFRRIWALLSLLWIGLGVYFDWDYHGFWSEIFYVGILPCIVIYALAAALVWVIEGFARTD